VLAGVCVIVGVFVMVGVWVIVPVGVLVWHTAEQKELPVLPSHEIDEDAPHTIG